MCQQKESNSFNLADYNVMFVLLEMQENSVSIYVYLIQQFKDKLTAFVQPFLHRSAGCFYTHTKKSWLVFSQTCWEDGEKTH